ncbi:hypothetical protein QUW37_01170 [Ligilactobacillus aviarius]|uniref:hypothetical protein n=1 Tax=Ligilactobacillus aviarius TaxID=1606 RepID=UPI0025A49DBC|nr:hypothetical protein [Ligilactobacillus aviarius]MDM8277827.1 hypothetical protein [Ligilactobacillus aviarius]
MDKGKIMNQLQQKMQETYPYVEVLEYCGALALKIEEKIIARFKDWNPDSYCVECGPNYTEWALSNGILLEFYKEGRKLLKNPIKKYRIRVLKGKSAERCSSYLNVNYRANIVTFASDIDFEEWRASFTKNEIEELKKYDNLAIDWDKVELEEVDDEN